MSEMTMSEMKATYLQPTGFSDPFHYEKEVEIVGFAFGNHPDAQGYGRRGDVMLAIFRMGTELGYAPIEHFRLSTPSDSERK